MTDEIPHDPENVHDQDTVAEASRNNSQPNATTESSETALIDYPVDESLSRRPPGLKDNGIEAPDSNRGIRRPSQTGTDQLQNRHTLAAESIESTGQFGQHPKDVNAVDDIMPTDLLFHSRDPFDSDDTFVNAESLDLGCEQPTSLLNEGMLKSTVDDVESSLRILSNDDSHGAKKHRSHQRPMQHRASVEQTNPLVFLTRGANKSARLDAMLPAPLAIDDNDETLSTTLVAGIESSRASSQISEDPAKSIENIADDAVQMMSRSIDAAGGETLDAELAREIRVNLTLLLSEWQKEETQRRSEHGLDKASSFEKPLS